MSGAARYQAYMLRLWAVGQGAGCDWRASLENAHTGEQTAFVDLESLCHHLQTISGRRPDAGERSRTGTTTARRGGSETGGVAMLYFQWVIIILLLAALLISLREPAGRGHRTYPAARHPPAGCGGDRVVG